MDAGGLHEPLRVKVRPISVRQSWDTEGELSATLLSDPGSGQTARLLSYETINFIFLAPLVP